MKKLFLLFITSSIFIVACNDGSSAGGNVKIENKFNKNIICILGYNYPDLTFSFTSKQAVLNNKFEIPASQVKEIDTLALCKKDNWDKTIKHSMLMLFVFDKDKLTSADKLEDALIGRYYFSYAQLMKTNGVITVDASKNNL